MATDFRQKYFGDKEKEEVKIPTGGEGLPSVGFIGPVDIVMAHRVFSAMDVASDEFKRSIPQPDFRRENRTGSFWNYYTDYEAAVVADKELGGQYGPQLYWFFKVPTAEVMNTPDMQKLMDGFGASITGETRIATYRSKMYRHEFHLVTMPTLVAALAEVMGYETPGFEIEELIVRDPIVDDTFQETMIGDVSKMDVFSCILGRRRVELWKALGEEDPAKYTLKPDSKGNEKFMTEAEGLRNCLDFIHSKLPDPIWGRFILATDPRVDAGFEAEKDGQWRPGNLPALTEIFVDKDAAKKAAQEDLEMFKEAGVEVSDPAVQTDKDEPDLPERWEGMRDTFVEMLVLPMLGKEDEEVKELVDKDSDKYGCSGDEMVEWKGFMEKGKE